VRLGLPFTDGTLESGTREVLMVGSRLPWFDGGADVVTDPVPKVEVTPFVVVDSMGCLMLVLFMVLSPTDDGERLCAWPSLPALERVVADDRAQVRLPPSYGGPVVIGQARAWPDDEHITVLECQV
jgi:hypothetical protein